MDCMTRLPRRAQPLPSDHAGVTEQWCRYYPAIDHASTTELYPGAHLVDQREDVAERKHRTSDAERCLDEGDGDTALVDGQVEFERVPELVRQEGAAVGVDTQIHTRGGLRLDDDGGNVPAGKQHDMHGYRQRQTFSSGMEREGVGRDRGWRSNRGSVFRLVYFRHPDSTLGAHDIIPFCNARHVRRV